ncbi:uncharacterized protein LOC111614978 [Centruroides sculpturatus]|uniref:uncharacterized protein LOC111614978 n=1 Tax=Centruroides sculpturatus TaxID=218467 RepID=UPI000C6D3A98|nr:uncharacterized protein LOC111614978 [Centruroides sculpturatus]
MNEPPPKKLKLSEAPCSSYLVTVQTETAVVATKTQDHQNAPVGTSLSEKTPNNPCSQCFMKKINEESFVDKTLLAWEFYHDADDRMLITAPPRFCKSTNINMLKEFFEIKHDANGRQIKNVTEENGNYVPLEGNVSKSWMAFKKMNIYKCRCEPKCTTGLCPYRKWFYEQFGQHPVISVDFKGLPGTCLERVLIRLNSIIHEEFKKHLYLITKAPKNDKRKIWVWSKKEL